MSEYIMEPGARLVIGPHGRPEESLGGACCSGCAKSGSSCGPKPTGSIVWGGTRRIGALGLDAKIVTVNSNTGIVPTPAPATTVVPGAASSAPISSMPVVVIAVGAIGVGAWWLLRRKRRK